MDEVHLHHAPRRSGFAGLVRIVIGQQLSTAAARTINDRIAVLCEGDICPQAIQRLAEQELRKCGVSAAKVRTLKRLSEKIAVKPNYFGDIAAMSDGDAMAELMAHHGIGEWSAAMFLIFEDARPDIFTASDSSLRRAINLLYRRNAPRTFDGYKRLAKRWSPYRSVASLFLWRWLDSR
jgi:DNA-3-methyladenine glycosylase II